MAKPPTDLAGLLVIDKPHGISSMQAVRVVRRKARRAKTGHAGTLDPLATGVLVMCIGRAATRTVPIIMELEKTYETVIDLSAVSETDDAEGPIHPLDPAPVAPARAQIESILQTTFTGEIEQYPPAHSAIKIGGRRAYKLARAGQDVKTPPRRVTIHRIDLLEYEWPHVSLRIRCSKGTYIRSIARDLGEALGTGGYLTELCRTAVGSYRLENAWSLNGVPDPLIGEHLLPIPQS